MKNKELHTTDTLLLEQITKGSIPAFETLFLEMYPALYRFAWRLTRQQEMAGDIVSDVFLKVWESHHTLSHVKDLRSYLYVTVRNHTLNQLKKRSTAGQHEQQAAGQAEQQSEDLLKTLLDVETIRLLMAAIDTLPASCQKVVRLGLEGYSTSEIAARLGISAPAVSQQKTRAVRLLRNQLSFSLLTVLILLLD